MQVLFAKMPEDSFIITLISKHLPKGCLFVYISLLKPLKPGNKGLRQIQSTPESLSGDFGGKGLGVLEMGFVYQRKYKSSP